ncbi:MULTISPECIES: PDDEXK family nuclease [Serratia]|uniref:DUF91 domain-containing protein n=1 Tax=Serratia sarumanii TaxID=3020826 RepID=A0ABW8QEX0_9GAMM|nr:MULTISPECIES: hypothetical protein [Serratia]ASL98427.1 hypothetical protein BVG96_12665 [Serratia marcescens]EGS9995401.1 hypothetical protein [Serratia marcescens]ELJ5770431.1 hypothetical protein [Serratia marcescens]ELJ5813968.1 hypothetical protein [Serratia marcescens]ELN8907326.1 hypothetical protein [Serratia marcescens]
MGLFTLEEKEFKKVAKTTFMRESILERRDIQSAIAKNMSDFLPDCLVIQEEFNNWENSQRRIDLLCIDKAFNLVVVELKRDEQGAHMELQAVRYAAMISQMTFNDAAECYQKRLDSAAGLAKNAEQEILKFCEREESEIADFNTQVRIVLISADFSTEVTNTVLWLNNSGLNVSCFKLSPYMHLGKVLVNFEQIIPLPEAKDFLVRQKRKETEARDAIEKGEKDYSKFIYKGGVYNKRNLAYELMNDWIIDANPDDMQAIASVFGDDIHRSLIKVEQDVIASRRKRFHDETVELASGEIVLITNQWSIGSIQKLINKFASLGYNIEMHQQE